jgi:hypothetical protein
VAVLITTRRGLANDVVLLLLLLLLWCAHDHHHQPGACNDGFNCSNLLSTLAARYLRMAVWFVHGAYQEDVCVGLHRVCARLRAH